VDEDPASCQTLESFCLPCHTEIAAVHRAENMRLAQIVGAIAALEHVHQRRATAQCRFHVTIRIRCMSPITAFESHGHVVYLPVRKPAFNEVVLSAGSDMLYCLPKGHQPAEMSIRDVLQRCAAPQNTPLPQFRERMLCFRKRPKRLI
jgi:hypothetical protein